jgi:hypothetical protein
MIHASEAHLNAFSYFHATTYESSMNYVIARDGLSFLIHVKELTSTIDRIETKLITYQFASHPTSQIHVRRRRRIWDIPQ